MRIDTLTLRNYRCFEQIEIAFHKQITVLVAPNGGGKTAILDAISIALSPFVGKTPNAKGKKFRVQDARRVLVPAGHKQALLSSPFKEIGLESSGTVDGVGVHWVRWKKTEKGDTTIKEASCLTDYAKRLLAMLSEPDTAPATTLPIIAYYGTGRLLGPRQFWLTAKEKRKALLPRTYGYQGCLSAGSRFDSFAAWFGAAYFTMLAGRMQRIDSGSTTPEHELLEASVRNVRDTVRFALRPYGDCWLDYDLARREIVITHPSRHTVLSLDQQSDGVQVVLAMVGDIASRTSLLNPQFGREAAKRTPGIVMIDEVDLHLHPTWQQEILRCLQEAFPNIQFIVTTHSPQVLSTVPGESIRILSRNEKGDWNALQPNEQTKGMESAYVMATIMGADPVPSIEETEWLKKYREYIERGQADADQAQELYAKLIAHFGKKHPLMLDCDRLARFQAFKRKKRQGEDD